MAFLIFFPRSARARIIIPGFLFWRSHSNTSGIRRIRFCNLLTLRRRIFLNSYSQKHSYSIFANSFYHCVEHFKALVSIFNNRILLSERSQTDTLFKLCHVVNMVHPLCINNLKKNNSFKLSYKLSAELRFLSRIYFKHSVFKKLCNISFFNLFKLVVAVVEILVPKNPAKKVIL